MNAKKVICIICCFILAFTLLSVPWRAEAEAAGPAIAIAVVAIVGFFIVTSGYTFDSQADFRTATDAFMESEAAQYVTKITDIVTDIASAGISLANFNLSKIIAQPWFLDFWQTIQNYFGSGEVEAGTVTAPSGYAYFNGTLLPDLPTVSEYEWLYSSYTSLGATSYTYYYPCIFETPTQYYLYFLRYDNHQLSGGYPKNENLQYDSTNDYVYWNQTAWGTARFYINKSNIGSGDWILWQKKLNSDSSSYNLRISLGAPTVIGDITYFDILWSSFTFKAYSAFGNYAASEIIINASSPVTSVQGDVIGVYEDENKIAPSDVIGGFDAAGIDGSIDWALSNSAVYQDLTQAGSVPMTSTQTGSLSESGVSTQTSVKVESMNEYARPSLTSVFPFCIPFDIYKFLSILVAEREAPHFEFQLDFGRVGAYDMEIDLSEFEEAVKVLRILELLAFCVGLAVLTSKVIKW